MMTPDQAPHPHQDPRAEFYRTEYARRNQRQKTANITLLCWIVMCFISFAILLALGDPYVQFSFTPFLAICLGIFVAALFQFINHRCPCCNKGQARVNKPRFCFNCGTRLRD